MRALMAHLIAIAKLLLVGGIVLGYILLIAFAAPLFEWYGLVGALLCLLLFGWIAIRHLFGEQALACFAAILFTATVVGMIVLLHLGRGGLAWWQLLFWYLGTGLAAAVLVGLRRPLLHLARLNAFIFMAFAVLLCAGLGLYGYLGIWNIWEQTNLAGFFEIAVYGLFAAAAALLILGLAGGRRDCEGVISLATLVACLIAFYLSGSNQDVIQRLKVDSDRVMQEEAARRKAIAAAERAKAIRAEELGGTVGLGEGLDAHVLTEEEKMDLEGMSAADAAALRRDLEAGRKARAEQITSGEPAYRRRKVERNIAGREGAAADEEEDERYRELGQEVEEEMRERVMNFRSLNPAEKITAMRLADLNYLSAKILLVVSSVMALVIYFQRLNRANCPCHPLPLAGRWLDDLAGKDHLVWLDTVERWVVERFLADAVAKGETFIHFTEEPLLPSGRLARWRFFGWDLPLDTHDHIVDDSEDFIPNSDFVFESAWTGTHSFTITGTEEAVAFLRDILSIAEGRRWSRAQAPHTLNLVWDLDEDIPADLFVALANQAKTDNLRIVLVGDQDPAPRVDARIEAIYDEEDF